MPNPAKFKSKDKFMEECMRTQKEEKGSIKGEKLAPAIGKCMGIWHGEKGGKRPPSKSAADRLRDIAQSLASL